MRFSRDLRDYVTSWDGWSAVETATRPYVVLMQGKRDSTLGSEREEAPSSEEAYSIADRSAKAGRMALVVHVETRKVQLHTGQAELLDHALETIRLWVGNDLPVYRRGRKILASEQPYTHVRGPGRVAALAAFVDDVLFGSGEKYRQLWKVTPGAGEFSPDYLIETRDRVAPGVLAALPWGEIAEALDPDNEGQWRP